MQERLGIDYLIEILDRKHIILEIERIAPYFHNPYSVQLRAAQRRKEQCNGEYQCFTKPHLSTRLVL